MPSPTTNLTWDRRAGARHGAAALILAATLLGSAGCASLATVPAVSPSQPGIAGLWVRDDAQSDDFDAKMAQVVKARADKLRSRRAAGGAGGAGGEPGTRRRGGGGSGGGGDEYSNPATLEIPPEDSEHFRSRLADDLRPPKTMQIQPAPGAASNGPSAGTAAVAILRDQEPERRYLPGQVVSRIDESGAAQIACGWDHDAFVIQAQYVHKASRSWRYEIEPASGLLKVRFAVNDPEIGKLDLTTRYRHQG